MKLRTSPLCAEENCFSCREKYIHKIEVWFSESFKNLAAACPTHQRHKYGIHIRGSACDLMQNVAEGVNLGDADVLFFDLLDKEKNAHRCRQIHSIKCAGVWSGSLATMVLERAVCKTTKFTLLKHENLASPRQPISSAAFSCYSLTDDPHAR